VKRIIFIRESMKQYVANCWELNPIAGAFLALFTPLVLIISIIVSFFTTDLEKIEREDK